MGYWKYNLIIVTLTFNPALDKSPKKYDTSCKNTGIVYFVFEGTFENCHFENCSFYSVKFQNATILNSFFKYNRKFKKVRFIDCKVDKLTYAFLKNNEADLMGITLLD